MKAWSGGLDRTTVLDFFGWSGASPGPLESFGSRYLNKGQMND